MRKKMKKLRKRLQDYGVQSSCFDKKNTAFFGT